MTLTGHIVGTKGNTGRGIASIVENADYTITINLTDGTSYTTAPIAGFTAVEFDENYDLVVTKTDGTTETVETDIEAFRTVLYGYKTDAETAESNASGYATAASGSASTATAKAKEAESYAKGGTSSRTGEDTDNADYYRGLAAASATAAGTSESNAGAQALKSEGYAVGKQNGTDVSSGSDYYHNNAKYYSDMAHIDATDASSSQSSASGSASTASAKALVSEGYAVGKQNGEDVSSGSDYYHNNSKYYKEQAASSATGASGSASSASASALVAEGWAKGTQNGTAVESGTYFEDNAKYYAEEAASSASDAAASAASLTVDSALSGSSTNPVQNKVIKGELDNKANIDGYYESLGSGTADQLASNIYEEDNTPYNFRTSGGSIDIGDRETDMIVGGTVAWNQLAYNPNFASASGWGARYGTVTVSNNIATVTPTSDGTARGLLADIGNSQTVLSGHKYLLLVDVLSPINSTCELSFQGVGEAKIAVTAGVWKTCSTIYMDENATTTRLAAYITGSVTTSQTIQYKNAIVADLTAMFGSTIADYIYSLEQTTAGAGVAFFRKLFPKPYYEYNAGELMSVNASSHDMVGFNQFDASDSSNWENWYIGSGVIQSGTYYKSAVIPCVPNTKYYACKDLGNRLFLASFPTYPSVGDTVTAYQGNNVGKETNLTTGENDHYLVVWFYNQNADGTNYQAIADTLNINISWDGERDGEYEPYIKHSYPLDSSLTIRGIPKLDASNNLYYDGDTYESDGTVTRKYGIVDLGTLTYTVSSSDTFYAIISDKMNGYGNIMCAKYVTASQAGVGNMQDKQVVGENGGKAVYVKDSALSGYTTAQVKTAMNGVYLVYELATPTTETADPYTNPQIVDDFGTEEYVDYAVSQGDRDVSIPVGHYTQYMANLKAKLEMSPNSPEGAGDYIVRQTNGENEYVTLASNATIQDIIARLEALEGGE